LQFPTKSSDSNTKKATVSAKLYCDDEKPFVLKKGGKTKGKTIKTS
jgi:hypothetical protein